MTRTEKRRRLLEIAGWKLRPYHELCEDVAWWGPEDHLVPVDEEETGSCLYQAALEQIADAVLPHGWVIDRIPVCDGGYEIRAVEYDKYGYMQWGEDCFLTRAEAIEAMLFAWLEEQP